MFGRLTRRQKIVNVVTITVILGILGVVLYLARTNAANASVGDCLKPNGSTSLEQVECDDAQARYRVVGKVEHKTEAEAVANVCDPYRNQGAVQVYWTGRSGRLGTVLCLTNVAK